MREERLLELLKALEPLHIEIENESGQHSGPATESHFKILIVSAAFEGQGRVQRQRRVNELVAEEFAAGLHALSLRCLSPAEAETQIGEFRSPDCASSKTPAES